jgi:hypothetical protein
MPCLGRRENPALRTRSYDDTTVFVAEKDQNSRHEQESVGDVNSLPSLGRTNVNTCPAETKQ